MIQCNWCPKEVEDNDVVALDIDMPNYTGPYLRIRNNLCEDCSLKARIALAEVELRIRNENASEEDDQSNTTATGSTPKDTT